MIFNFEVEIGDKLYDCDAEDGSDEIELLEIRLVGEDGSSFVVVRAEELADEVLVEIKAAAEADRQEQVEAWRERQAEGDR